MMIMTKTKFYKQISILLTISFLLMIVFLGVLEGSTLVWSITNNPSSGDDYTYSITSDNDFIYITGHDDSSGNSQWRIEKRSKSDGGVVWTKTSNPSSDYDWTYSITADDTYIYVVGDDNSLGNWQWRIEKRRKSDGGIVWTKTSNPSSGSDAPSSIAADDTYIYIVGFDEFPGNYQWRIEKRRKSDGGVVWTETSNPSSGGDCTYSITADDTYIYVVGNDKSPGNYQWRIEKRRKSDGGIVWTETSNPSSGPDGPFSIAADAIYIYIVGIDGSPGNYQWRIEKRRKSDGGIVWTETSNPSSGSDIANSITSDSNFIYIAGYDNSPGNSQWRIEKRSKSDGGIVWTETSNLSSQYDKAYSITSDNDFIYTTGHDEAPGDAQWCIEKRSKSVPEPDPELSVSPTSYDFGTSETSYQFTVTNTGGGTLNWSVSEGIAWLSLNKSGGSLSGGSSENVTATVNRTGITPGSYSGIISFTSSYGSQNVTVWMSVPEPDPELSVSPPSYDFGTSETSYQFTVTNTGGGTLNWSVSEGISWLSLNKSGGSLSGGSSENVTATVNRTGQSPGPYSGIISFTSSYGSQNVTVWMTVPDTIPPEIYNLTVNPAIAKAGANLTITFTVSEALQGNPAVTVGGNAATFYGKSGNNYTYTYTVQGTEGEGNKTVNVSATDLAGNDGSGNTTVTFDFTAPTISNLTVNPAIAKAGANLTIAFTVSEALPGNPAVTVAGNAATFYGKSGNSYTYTYTVQGTEGEGNKTVNISATDLAGNTGSGNTTVTFDFTEPTISNLTVNPAIAKAGANLTIAFTVSEALPGNPAVTVGGNAATFYGKSGNSYTYTYTVQGTEGEGNKTVNISATDLAGNTGSASTTVTFDFTEPTISNLTVNPAIAKAGANLTIAFTVSEALPGNPMVTVAGNAATFNSKSGNNYTYTYTVQGTEGEGNKTVNVSATDLAGNTGSASTTVKFDFTAPTISNLTVNPAIAKAGVNLTIAFTVSETLESNPMVTVAGNAATFYGKSGNSYTYTYTVQGTEGEGNKTVNISATDLAGNNGSGNTTVTFDFTEPTISNLTVNPAIAKSGANLTITFTVSEALPGNPMVTVAGNAATFNSKSGNNYTYTYTVQGTEGEGNKTVNVLATDLAGNTGSASTTVTFDFTGPSCSANNWGIWHAEDITITLSASDNISGIAITKYNWDTPASETIGTEYSDGDTIILDQETGTDGKTLYLYAKDNVGNENTWNGTYYLDKEGPICSADNSKDWHTEDITITLSYSASTGYITIAKYNWDTPASETTGTDYSNEETISLTTETDGKILYLYVKDNEGREKTWSGTYYLDKTDPSCSANNSGIWHTENITITLSESDSISGIATARYNWDTPASATAGIEYSDGNTITLTTETGPEGKILYLYVKDNAGREKTWNGTYYLDKTPPSNCSVLINNGNKRTNSTSVTLNLRAEDSGSGVSGMRFSTDTVHYSELKDYATYYAFTLPEGDGEKTVYAKFKDGVGNWSDPVSDTIILDTITPTVELKVDNDKSTILPDGEIVGVLPDTGMEAKFSKVMDTESVKEGLKLIAVKDKLNNSINEEVSLNFAWEGSTKTVITPVSELKKNHLYSLKVTTTVTDLAGNTVEGERETIFRTIMDHTEKNVIVKETNEKLMVTLEANALAATLEANALTVTLEANALKEDGYLIINTEPLTYQFEVDPESINVANEKSITNRWYPIEGCLWEIKVCKGNGDWLEDKFAYEVKITFPYDEDNGEVGNAPIPLKEETLQAFWLNEEHCNWVRVPGSRVDREKNVVVTGEVSHFSVFALMGSAVYDLSPAHAYPVPWKPNDGKKETGNEEGITFTDLSTQGVIKIYTISGELVREYDYKSADGKWTWDVKTSSGEKVFSGVYIYYIKNEKEHKTGRLIIIR